MSKVLITSGCSFSECMSTHIDTWPRHLARILDNHGYVHKSYAMGSQGNGLISRGAMHGAIEALKTNDPKDILVGVMWSGASRYDFRCADPNDLMFVQEKIHNGWIRNPTQFISGAPKNWVILNQHWGDDQDGLRNPEAKMYYKYFYDEIGSSIRSIEHILRLQLFLELKGIPYFFTNYSDQNIVRDKLKDNVEIKYLYDQINFDKYLPVSSEFRWCYENSKFTHLWPEDWRDHISLHPKTEMHKEFVDQVIVPWLQEKYAGMVFNG